MKPDLFPLTGAAIKVAHNEGMPPPSVGAIMQMAAAENTVRACMRRLYDHKVKLESMRQVEVLP